MFNKKLEALERRLVKLMAKDEKSKVKYEPAYKHAREALEAANEGNMQKAYNAMTRFNTIMNEYKLNGNV
jgi:soluble cytochrome b562